MFAAKTCAAVIPCLNEAGTIMPLVSALRRYLPSVIVVDDGSMDGTTALAGNAGAVVVSHERNLGKGAALRTGLSQALKSGFGWAATLDGDGQHVPDHLPAFLRCAEQTGALLVVGNRMHHARAIPWLRREVNRWMSRQLSRRARRHLPDTQCGFRLIHLETWANLALNTEHFEIESEMLMAFLAAGHPVRFCSHPGHRSRAEKPYPSGDGLAALVEMVAWAQPSGKLIRATRFKSMCNPARRGSRPSLALVRRRQSKNQPAYLEGFQTYFPVVSM